MDNKNDKTKQVNLEGDLDDILMKLESNENPANTFLDSQKHNYRADSPRGFKREPMSRPRRLGIETYRASPGVDRHVKYKRRSSFPSYGIDKHVPMRRAPRQHPKRLILLALIAIIAIIVIIAMLITK